MSPSQPEVHRSGRTPLDPDHIETQVEVEPHAPRDEPGGGPVPEANQPGHHPEHDQDKPDLDEFAAKFGTTPPDDTASSDDTADASDETATDEASGAESERSTAETVTSMMSSGLSTGASVAGSAVRGLWGAAGRLADKKRGATPSSSTQADADRIARLESRVADLERQLRAR